MVDPGEAREQQTRSSLHEEFKRRIKTQTVLPSADTAAMLFWALLAFGQINMRKVDRWRTLAKVHHVTAIARVAEDLGEDEDWLEGMSPMKWGSRTA